MKQLWLKSWEIEHLVRLMKIKNLELKLITQMREEIWCRRESLHCFRNCDWIRSSGRKGPARFHGGCFLGNSKWHTIWLSEHTVLRQTLLWNRLEIKEISIHAHHFAKTPSNLSKNYMFAIKFFLNKLPFTVHLIFTYQLLITDLIKYRYIWSNFILVK